MIFCCDNVMLIGAHPDDIELGCGALLAHISGDTDVLCVTLSDNQKNPTLKGIVDEHRRSMSVLGVQPERVVVGQFETRNFPRDRQDILEYLISLNTEHHPDVVFVHTRADMHQDHRTVTQEARRAFRGSTILGFDVLRSSDGFFPHFLVEVTADDVQRKVQALAEYKTYAGKYYFNPDVTRSTLIRHGALAGKPYAEGFDILQIVGSFGRGCEE